MHARPWKVAASRGLAFSPRPPPPAAGAVVVGGGVAGLYAALTLQRAGAGPVVVLERRRVGSGGTGPAAGLVEQASRGPQAAMLRFGVRDATRLQAEARRRLFVRTGSLRVAATDAGAERAAEHCRSGREAGVHVEEVQVSRGRTLVPYARWDDVQYVTYTADDGHLDGQEMARALADAVVAAGGMLREGVAVRELLLTEDGSAVRGVAVEQPGGGGEGEPLVVESPVVVNAAGPWAIGLGGVDLPLQARGHYYLRAGGAGSHSPDVRGSPSLFDTESHLYTRPGRDNLLALGMSERRSGLVDASAITSDAHMARLRAERDAYQTNELLDAASRRFPFLLSATVGREVVSGLISTVADGLPLVGRPAGGPDGLFVNCGHGRIGVGMAAASAVVLTDLVLGRSPSRLFDGDALRADRPLPGAAPKAGKAAGAAAASAAQ